MSIRLIRVSKELNVGISSLVEFLDTKGVQIEANPNIKIDNEHYEMLVVEFGKDKNMKKTVEREREKQLSKDKKETVAIEGYDIPDKKQKKSEEKVTTASSLTDDNKPQFKIVGAIDLDNLKSKPKEKSGDKEQEVKGEKVATSKKPEKEIEKPDKIVESTPQPQPIKEKPEEKEVIPQPTSEKETLTEKEENKEKVRTEKI